jgi:hypothetical protein
MYSEHSFHKASKEVIKEIVDSYQESVAKYYTNLLAGKEKFNIFGMELEGDYNKTPEARLADIENCLAQKVHAFKH